MRQLTISVAVILAMTAAASAQTAGKGDAGKGAALPGGSSSLQETFEDWTVRCAVQNNTRICKLQQQQRHRETNQLALAIDLEAGAKNTATGTIVMPFGLRLAAGITLQLDDEPASKPLSFSTCLPVGCLVPLALDAPTVTALRTSKVLKLAAVANDSGQAVALTISLKGFPSAHDRVKALDGK
ncbi:MAG: invasion associated locus B family protein [Hyphomicrobiaceae bacterium]